MPSRRALLSLAQGTTNELLLLSSLYEMPEKSTQIHRFGCRNEAVLMSRIDFTSASNILVVGIMLRKQKGNE